MGTDSMSIYTALSMTTVKTPQENTLGAVLHWLKEKLHLGVIHMLRWYDTRDMSCDGHTKGAVDRKILLDIQKGIHAPQHAVK